MTLIVNDVAGLAEKMMVLRLCGFVINAHVEHLMTYEGWLPLGPMAPDYDDPKCENTRTIRLLEDATVETSMLANTAQDLRGSITAEISRIADHLEKMFHSNGGIALAPVGALIEIVKDAQIFTPEQQSVIDRTIQIFQYHKSGDAIRSEQAIQSAAFMLSVLNRAGLFKAE